MNTALIIPLLILGILSRRNLCQSNECQVPQNPKNGQVNCVKDSDGILKCYATCNSGFTFESTSVEFRTCSLVDGTWENGNTFPDCRVSASRCQSLSPPKNGVVKCETVSNQLVCSAKCDRQHVFPTGQTTIRKVCDVSNGWQPSDQIPDCKVDCNTQYLISGNRNITNSNFITSSVLTETSKTYSPRKSDIYCTDDCGWRPTSSDLSQFVQINLLKPSRLLGITTKGVTVDGGHIYVTRFRILHSMDGRSFVPYSDENVTDRFFSGNSDGATPKLHVFSCPFQAQYVRINPLEWHDGIGLRFDLLGCDLDSLPDSMQTATVPTTVKQTVHTIQQQSKQTTSQPPATQHQQPKQTSQVPISVTSGQRMTSGFQACSAILPPANGAVNCQKNNDELSCTAICNDGFQFATNDQLVKITCQIQTGQWDGNKVFPACIPKQDTVSTARPKARQCISTQSDCNVFGNGDYNTCGDCRYFATCSEGVVYIRSCPTGLRFDSLSRTCEFRSQTCHPAVPFG